MKLSFLLKELKEKTIFNFKDLEIKNIVDNSKDVKEGSLFVAIKGERHNGHLFIKEAKERGAIAFVVEDKRYIKKGSCFILVPSSRKALAKLLFRNLPFEVIGVTGTNGKTTTVFLIESILNTNFPMARFSTVGHRIGNLDIPATLTTPHPLELHKLLQIAKDKGIKYVVMEVSSHALALDRVFGIRFSRAIFTNITQDHLDFHKSFSNYLNAKRKLFLSLDNDSKAIVNIDCPFYKKIISKTKAGVITYGIKNDADFRGENIEEGISGISFSLKGERIKIPIYGIYNVYNCLAAIAAAISYGIPFNPIKEALINFKAPPGRFEVIYKNPKVVIDYAHTPDALLNALKTCWSIRPKRVILVFGCGGNREKEKRPIMGRIASEHASFTIITSDNPRDEDPLDIIDEIGEGISKNYLKIPDRALAIKKACEYANPDDLVLIAGKGHEEYQIIGNNRIPFKDKEVALKILKDS